MAVEVVQGEVADGGVGDDDFDARGGYFFDYLYMYVSSLSAVCKKKTPHLC